MAAPGGRSQAGGSPGNARRGATLVEFVLIAGFVFTMLFGVVEFSWIANTRQALQNGAYGGVKAASLGSTVAAVRNAVRKGSALNVQDSSIVIESNSADDGSGAWRTVADDPASGSPPLANGVAAGKPIRIRIASWPYRLLTGRMFSFIPNTGNGNLYLNASMQGRRF